MQDGDIGTIDWLKLQASVLCCTRFKQTAVKDTNTLVVLPLILLSLESMLLLIRACAKCGSRLTLGPRSARA